MSKTSAAPARQPTFRNTLLSKHLPGFTFVRETFYERVVRPSGYPYFEWGDRIYEVTADAGGSYRDTERTIGDLV